jgi:hypothetical protein
MKYWKRFNLPRTLKSWQGRINICFLTIFIGKAPAQGYIISQPKTDF